MNPYLLLAAAEGCSQSMVPALLDPHLDVDAAIHNPPPGTPPAVRSRLARPAELRATVEAWITDSSRRGIEIVTPPDPDFPTALRDAPLRPLALFVVGDTTPLREARHAVTIVGSRTPTAYGRAAANDFGTALASAGISVWSGLAAGIDRTAHETCLAAGVPTVAVLAGGLDRVYPASHAPLFEQIRTRGGACVSELPPGRRPQRGHFPRRNRILALATSAVLVIEAGLASGSLHTARFAAETGVPVHAVPGPYTSERSAGCHRLIADGASVAASPSELLHNCGIQRAVNRETDAANSLTASAEAHAILQQLALGPRPTDLVRRESRLEDDRFLPALVQLLELRLVVELEGDLIARRDGPDRSVAN